MAGTTSCVCPLHVSWHTKVLCSTETEKKNYQYKKHKSYLVHLRWRCRCCGLWWTPEWDAAQSWCCRCCRRCHHCCLLKKRSHIRFELRKDLKTNNYTKYFWSAPTQTPKHFAKIHSKWWIKLQYKHSRVKSGVVETMTYLWFWRARVSSGRVWSGPRLCWSSWHWTTSSDGRSGSTSPTPRLLPVIMWWMRRRCNNRW